MYNLISMSLALFINKNSGTREVGVRQPRKTVSKLINNISKCYRTEETVCLPYYLQLKQVALDSIPSGCPGIVSLPAGLYTNADGMKDLWCSSTAQLLSTQI